MATTDKLGIAVPHIEQYSGAWAMYEPAFNDVLAFVRGLDLTAHLQANTQRIKVGDPDDEDDDGTPAYKLTDGIAQVDMVGMMTKYGSSLSSNPGSVRMRRVMRAMAADPNVKGIVLRIDSPGGSAAGTDDLAEDVAAVAKIKPVVAYIEDLAASAAYYVASQATRIIANPGALVGSIGTYMVVADYSRAAANEGVEVNVIRAGKFKGAGTYGTEVTDEQLTEFQRNIDAINGQFLSRVMSGRRMDRKAVEAVADGRVHIASEAIKFGLIDGISTLDSAAAELRTSINARPQRTANKVEVRMSANQSDTPEQAAPADTRPKAATLAELKTLDGSTSDQRERWQEQGFTLEQATKDFARSMAEQLKATQAENEKLKAAAAKAEPPSRKIGLDTKGERAGAKEADQSSGDPIHDFNAAVSEHVGRGMKKWDAIKRVAMDNPSLHGDYLAAVNAQVPGNRERRQTSAIIRA